MQFMLLNSAQGTFDQAFPAQAAVWAVRNGPKEVTKAEEMGIEKG